MTVRALPRPVSPAADLVSLLKPRLSSLVLCTVAGGMWLAPGELSLPRWVATLLGTAGTVGAANVLNCWLERDRDRFMARTRLRPLPSGRMESGVALGFGILLAVFSLPLLAMASNGLTGCLGFLALVSGDDATRVWMLLWTVLLVVLSMLLVPFGIAGWLYLVAALGLGAAFLALVTRGVLRREQRAWARQTVLFSLVYLAGLFAALLLSARAH